MILLVVGVTKSPSTTDESRPTDLRRKLDAGALLYRDYLRLFSATMQKWKGKWNMKLKLGLCMGA